MDDSIKISVIVPIFNASKYLERLIVSVLSQTYHNFELLLINDGSNDNSFEIMKKYSISDSRIRIFNNDNRGVSYTRNFGIDNSLGEYVIFIDADDYIDNNHIENFVSLVRKYNAPIGFGIKHYKDDLKLSKSMGIMKEISSDKIVENIYRNIIYMAVWNRIYKKSFLIENNIKFDENIWYAEGMLFNIKCLKYVQKVPICDLFTYHYMSNPNSVMRKQFNINNEFCAKKSLEIQKDYINYSKKDVRNSYKYHQLCIDLNILYGIKENEPDYKIHKEYIRCKKNIRKNLFLLIHYAPSFKNKKEWLRIALKG